MHRNVRRLATAVTVATVGVGVVGVGAPAQAAEKPRITITCSSAGFTGSVRLYGKIGTDPWGGKYILGKVTRITYMIKAKKGHGNRKNNDVFVYFNYDGKNTLIAKSGDKAVSDNNWHVLREKDYSLNRKRLFGRWIGHFIFDKRDAKDPQCAGRYHN